MSLNSSQYEASADQIKSILQDAETTTVQRTDNNLRRRLVQNGRKLATSLEQPRDTGRGLGTRNVPLPIYPWMYSSLQPKVASPVPLTLVGVDPMVLVTLAAESRSCSSSEHAQKTGVDEDLSKRLSRYYQATDVVSQTEENTHRPNNVCGAMSNDDHADTIRWTQECYAHYPRSTILISGCNMRRVMETCKEILLNAKAAMTKQSVFLIDEVVFPERGATAQGAQMDIELMICAGGIERTEAQWASLLNSAGLKMLEVVKYDKDYEDAVIVVGLD